MLILICHLISQAITNELMPRISLAFPSCEKECIGEGLFRMKYLRRRRNHMEQWSTPERRGGNKNIVRLEVLPRRELGSLDSESKVLTITPQNHLIFDVS